MENTWLSIYKKNIDKIIYEIQRFLMSDIIFGKNNINFREIIFYLTTICNNIQTIEFQNLDLKSKISRIEENVYFEELSKEMKEKMPEKHEQKDISKIGKSISKSKFRNLGISETNATIVNTTDELRKNPPNIVIAECIKDINFSQNMFKPQQMKKKNRYVMSVGVFKSLHYDSKNNKRVLKPSTIKFKNIYKPYIGQDLTDKHLLISRTGGIGDLLFIQPSILFLKEKYPTCKITLACGPQYHAMIENWECLDEVLSLPFVLSKLMNTDYHAIFEGVIERCQEAHTTNAIKLFSQWLGLDIPVDKLVPIQIPKKEKVDECKNILRDLNILDNKFVLLQIRASSYIRTPRPEVWYNIVNFLTGKGYRVLITDSPSKAKSIDDFIENVDNKKLVFNFANISKTLDYTIAMASLACIAIGPDSSLMHIASSLGTKCFGVYGAFTGDIRLSTYKNTDWVNCKTKCSPCFRHGPYPCPNSKNNYSLCYDNIDYNVVYEKLERMIGDGRDV